jgi:hypothetical protein
MSYALSDDVSPEGFVMCKDKPVRDEAYASIAASMRS